MCRAILILLLLLAGTFSKAQGVLDRYVQEALNENQARKLTQLELQKQQSKLKEAVALYLPSVTFDASYTLADGGRLIQFPVGDLLNPVYNTLNQLTESDQFPTCLLYTSPSPRDA